MNYASPDWQETTRRLTDLRAVVLKELCNDIDENKTQTLRGSLRTIDRILNWPQEDADHKTNEEPIEFV